MVLNIILFGSGLRYNRKKKKTIVNIIAMVAHNVRRCILFYSLSQYECR